MNEIGLRYELGVFVLYHLVFLATALSMFLLPLKSGIVFSIVVIYYSTGFLIIAIRLEFETWKSIWKFSAPISAFQLIPDWILSDLLNVLVFPPDGGARLGGVSAYMAGLWIVPFVICIYTGTRLFGIYGSEISLMGAALMGLLIFTLSEMTLWRLGSWYAVDVATTLHVAHYIILPEVLLSTLVFLGYHVVSGRRFVVQAMVGGLVTICYTGAVIISYFFVEFV